MHLAFVVQDLYPRGGGTGVYYEQVSRHFARSGDRVWLISATYKDPAPYKRDGVSYIHVPTPRSPVPFTSLFLWDWNVASVLRSLEVHYGLDIVEFPSYFPEGLIYAFSRRHSAVCFRLFEWKHPLSLRQCVGNIGKFVRETACWLQMAKSDALIAESSAIQESYIRFMGSRWCEHKMHCTFLGVDMTLFAPTNTVPMAYHSLRGQRILLFVGRITEAKGTYQLLDAFTTVIARRFPDTSLVLVGQPEDTAKFNTAMETCANSRVIHIDRVDQGELAAFYSHAYMFVGPSSNEPLGLVFVEALACGLPVISVAQGGPLEIVEHDRTGILCSDNSVDSIANAMERLLSDRKLRDRMAQSCRASVVERFGYTSIVSELSNTYRSILLSNQNDVDAVNVH